MWVLSSTHGIVFIVLPWIWFKHKSWIYFLEYRRKKKQKNLKNIKQDHNYNCSLVSQKLKIVTIIIILQTTTQNEGNIDNSKIQLKMKQFLFFTRVINHEKIFYYSGKKTVTAFCDRFTWPCARQLWSKNGAGHYPLS